MLIYDRLQRAQCLLPRRIHYHCLAHNGDQYTGGNETCADWSAPQWASHIQKADWIMETRWIETKQTRGRGVGGFLNLHFIEFTSVKSTSYLVAELVWPLRQKPFESCSAGGRRNGMWVFNEMKKWNKPYLSPLILLSSFLAVQQVLQVKLLLFSDQVNWRHFSVSSSRLWLNRAEMETLISWLLHFPPLSHTHKPKNLLPSPHPTPQWDFFPFSFYFSPSSSPYSVSLRVSFKFLLRVSSPFTLGWAFQALSASFKFLTSCRGRNKETEGGGKSPWSEIERYISHETLCSDVE